MNTLERRYDIDALRVIAIGLLLIYHLAVGFQQWGVLLRFIQSDKPLESIWVPMSMLNVWRIPLLFFVSGMGVYFAMRKRNWKQLIKERTLRILLPFVFGVLAIVPLHHIIWQDYYQQPLSYLFHPVHLWFLGNLFIYVILLAPLFFYLKRKEGGKVDEAISKVLSSPFGLVLVVLLFMAEAAIINPESFEYYSLNLHGFVLGLLAFLCGFCFMYSGKAFTNTVKKWKWLTLALALGLYLVRLEVYELNVPNYQKALESCLWIFTVFGFGFTYLNKPSKTLTYLSQAAYPVYILHMVFLYLGSALIFPLSIGPWPQFVAIALFTGVGCILTYELIRRLHFVRPLFGLRVR